MTAAFNEQDWSRICRAVNEEFIWRPVKAMKHEKRFAFCAKRERQLQSAFNQFRYVMESDNPPRSKEEAIRQVLGLLRTGLGMLSWIFPQYALLIAIIGFLWDVSTGQNVTITNVASGAAEGSNGS